MLKIAVWCLTSPEKHFITLRAHWWLHFITRSRECDARLVVPMGEQVRPSDSAVVIGVSHIFFNFLVLFCWLVSVGFSLVRVDMIGDAVLLCLFDLSCCTVRVACRVRVSDCNLWLA